MVPFPLTVIFGGVLSLLGSGSGFQIQDVGNSGWLSALVPSTRNTGTFALRNRQQPGSRIYYIDPVSGVDPIATGWVTPSSTCPADVYFWDGTNLIDSDGSTTGAGGVAYGTDPLNPSGPVKPFKTWAFVGPRSTNVGQPDIGDTTQVAAPSAAGIGLVGTNLFRATFPDYWLFKRGTTCDLYSDMRSWYDATGRSATALPSGCVLKTSGGRNSSELSVIGAYGPVSAGRARLIHCNYGFFGHSGTSINYKHVRHFGLLCDGSARNRALRPVDWGNGSYETDDNVTGMSFVTVAANCENVWFEDIHWHESGGPSVQFDVTHTVLTDFGGMHRYLVTDAWDEGYVQGASGAGICKGAARKQTTDPDQTFTANVVTTVTWPFADTGAGGTAGRNGWANTAAFANATGIFTVPSGTPRYKWWYLMDIIATIPANGTLEVVLFKNGAEIAASVPVVGTGVTDDTYQVHGTLYTGASAAGNTFDLRVRTINATGNVSVKGTGFSRVQIRQLFAGGNQGLFMRATTGTKIATREYIMLRNGFNDRPTAQGAFPGAMPTGGYFDYSIFNHNIYTNGTALAGNVTDINGVSMMGSAGDVQRCLADKTQCFIYNGYQEHQIEHNDTPYSSPGGKFNDNVIQRFRATVGNFTAHPGWGFRASGGTNGYEIKRNVISDVSLNAFAAQNSQGGIQIQAIYSPYNLPLTFRWSSDHLNTAIEANIIDCTGLTGSTTGVIQEGNGGTNLLQQWQCPITGTVGLGNVLTVNPTAGYTGTPTYQWYRNDDAGGTVQTLVPGETNATYTQVAGDFHAGNAYHLMVCKVSGITYPTGVGIGGTTLLNNVHIRSAGADVEYYALNTNAGNATTSPPAIYPSVPAASNISNTNTQVFASREAAASSLAWPNSEACLKSYLQALGVTVTSTDGFPEYYSTVIGSNPILTAWRRGRWDDRLLGRQLGNHVRVGRAMAPL